MRGFVRFAPFALLAVALGFATPALGARQQFDWTFDSATDPTSFDLSGAIEGTGRLSILSGTGSLNANLTSDAFIDLNGSATGNFSINPTTVNITAQSSNNAFGSLGTIVVPGSGSFSLTADDNLVNDQVGVVDQPIVNPAGDGAWDDTSFSTTSLFQNVTLDSGIVRTGPIPAVIDVPPNSLSGSLSGSGSVGSGFVQVPVDVSGSLSGNIAQPNLSLQQVDINLGGPLSTSFPAEQTTGSFGGASFDDGAHPNFVGDVDIQSLSMNAIYGADGTIDLRIVADIIGTISASVDIEFLGFITINAFDDTLIDGTILTLDETLSLALADISLPGLDGFPIQAILDHVNSPNPDFDDLRASLLTGTGPIFLPLTLTIQDTLSLVEPFDFSEGDITANGNIDADITIDAALTIGVNLNLLIDGLETYVNAVNLSLIPEPGTWAMIGVGGLVLGPFAARRIRRRKIQA